MKSLFVWSRFLFRWPTRPTLSLTAAPVLFGALVLTGCGGSGEASYARAVQNYHHIGEALHGQ
ncbi:hypothetical protein [Mitsuaria sp. 7]|uniref:hypothetical protein n=1 Tax=Mitsuaria sp. 7 TaxID=1658665 RepID=UPI0007DCBCF9|nr:hypothetical protein [Mitsuaria sp. 7]ANH66976.1 hypothetical protein ABE85_04290 [Mitsuaria sp. 7]